MSSNYFGHSAVRGGFFCSRFDPYDKNNVSTMDMLVNLNNSGHIGNMVCGLTPYGKPVTISQVNASNKKQIACKHCMYGKNSVFGAGVYSMAKLNDTCIICYRVAR